MQIISRNIKSFVLRNGKITSGQLNAIEKLKNIYCIDYQISKINFNDIFSRNNQKIIEIGFGMGKATSYLALQNPHMDYIGVEVHSPGVGSLLMEIEKLKISNLKIIQHDVTEVLSNMVSDDSINGFHIFCPDPWPKKKHHKRRLINQDFITLLVKKLVLNGYIYITTDWEHYAEQIEKILSHENSLIKSSSYLDKHNKPVTKFEQKGLDCNRKICEFIFKKV